MRTVVITGGSGGIGLACCEKFREAGYRVFEISRREPEIRAGITHIAGDVTDEESIRLAFTKILSETGRIDILVNNAGFGIAGSIEYTSLDDAKQQFDVNFFGMFLCSKQVIDPMRQNGGGRIVNISSLAAPLAIPFQGFYSASKAAVNSLTLALANEVRPFGITVAAVMPGDVCTGFTDARRKSTDGERHYGSLLQKSVATMERDERSGMAPAKIADAVFHIATTAHPKPLSSKGAQYRTFAVLAKVLPASFINRLVGKIYAE